MPVADEDTEILMRLADPLRAEMIRDLLEDEGIVVALPGLEHRALLGIAGGYVDIVVRVPASDLERARAIVAALDSAEIVRDDDDDDLEHEPAPVTDRDATPGSPGPVIFHRSKRIAAFAGFWLPLGGAHLYARQYRAAAMLAALMAASVLAMISGVWLAILLPIAIVALDVAGATWHCDRSTTGVAPARATWRRFAAEIALLVVGAWWFAAPHAATAFAGENARELCRALAGCETRSYAACTQAHAEARLDRIVVDDACAGCARDSRTCDELFACPCW